MKNLTKIDAVKCINELKEKNVVFSDIKGLEEEFIRLKGKGRALQFFYIEKEYQGLTFSKYPNKELTGMFLKVKRKEGSPFGIYFWNNKDTFSLHITKPTLSAYPEITMEKIFQSIGFGVNVFLIDEQFYGAFKLARDKEGETILTNGNEIETEIIEPKDSDDKTKLEMKGSELSQSREDVDKSTHENKIIIRKTSDIQKESYSFTDEARNIIRNFTTNDIRELLVPKGKNWKGEPIPQPTDQELIMFAVWCEQKNLNPFDKEGYIIKHSQNDPAAFVVSYHVFLQRADKHKEYKGLTCGIIVEEGEEKELKEIEGSFKLDNQVLKGGWATIFRKDREPMTAKVKLENYMQTRADGKPNKFWSRLTEHMIMKTAVENALRFAFPNELSNVYGEQEII